MLYRVPTNPTWALLCSLGGHDREGGLRRRRRWRWVRIRSRRITALFGPCAIRPIWTAAVGSRAHSRPSSSVRFFLACKNLIFVIPVPPTTCRTHAATAYHPEGSLVVYGTYARRAYRQRDISGPVKADIIVLSFPRWRGEDFFFSNRRNIFENAKARGRKGARTVGNVDERWRPCNLAHLRPPTAASRRTRFYVPTGRRRARRRRWLATAAAAGGPGRVCAW